MSIADEKENQARSLVGQRVEIPVHYDMWMRGARYGVVTGWGKGKPGRSAFVRVKLDATGKTIKVWALDFDYMKHVNPRKRKRATRRRRNSRIRFRSRLPGKHATFPFTRAQVMAARKRVRAKRTLRLTTKARRNRRR